MSSLKSPTIRPTPTPESNDQVGRMSLDGVWGLTWAEGAPLMPPRHYVESELHGRRLIPAQVPAPIHQVLEGAGLIEDLNYGLNSLKARWVEEMFWIYRQNFDIPAGSPALESPAWLVFELLEYDAVVRLNGEIVGRHENANRPARISVTGKLKAGENLIVVEISTGLHRHADDPGGEHGSIAQDIELITKRELMRKPQYQAGWDWNARLGNVGILGHVWLEWAKSFRLDEMTLFAVPNKALEEAIFTVRATLENPGQKPVRVRLSARLFESGKKPGAALTDASAEVQLPVGVSRQELKLTLKSPKLWWPIGQGEQSLYRVDLIVESGEAKVEASRRTGVRLVELDQSPHPVEGSYYIIRINNRPIFCKGGNWIPADLLYSTVDRQRYYDLVKLAVDANFNLLRIWGGGLFTTHDLCEACDEMGVLIWHDFLFACAKYPGDDPNFLAEVRREMTWAVRDLAHHPSLVVWCGNNEIEWGDWAWGYDTTPRAHPHYVIFHHDIPLIVRTENPSVAHWTSSPFSPDQKFPNDPTVGDQHPWDVSIGASGGADWWTYRTYFDRFPNEGGVLGATSPKTMRQFLPEGERYIGSPSWDHHDNPFATIDKNPGELGHAYNTVRLWLGIDPFGEGNGEEPMSLDDYAFASALLQAEGLVEYIANYRRRMFSSSSAIFWMYNDSWPVTNGWTIIDYYLRKKLSYHPVRRAFSPVTVVVAEEPVGGDLTVFGVNDSPNDWKGEARFGLFELAGKVHDEKTKAVTLNANSSTPLGTIPRARLAELGVTKAGAFAVLVDVSKPDQKRPVAQSRLFVERFKSLELTQPRVKVVRKGDEIEFSADGFVWGVCLDLDGESPLADNTFDLIPGVEYRVSVLKVDGKAFVPEVKRTGNDLVRR